MPAHLRMNYSVMLEWGLDLPKPIPDLKIDIDGLSGTLSFGSGPRLSMFCFIPWSAVFALSSPVIDKGVTWLSDAPIEVQREILARASGRAHEKVNVDRNQARQMKGHLRIVKNDKGAA